MRRKQFPQLATPCLLGQRKGNNGSALNEGEANPSSMTTGKSQRRHQRE